MCEHNYRESKWYAYHLYCTRCGGMKAMQLPNLNFTTTTIIPNAYPTTTPYFSPTGTSWTTTNLFEPKSYVENKNFLEDSDMQMNSENRTYWTNWNGTYTGKDPTLD